MLTIAGLHKTYPGGVHALDDVSLDIPSGMFGLLGPNGAGKSTLMRTLATLQTPDSGRITLDGVDVLADPQTLRRQLGYLPQDFGVYPRTSAQVLLDHIAALKGVPPGERRELVEYLLVSTNLWEVRKQNIDTFSGGMRQRFGIAQALIGEPRLIIVDEPTAGLDPVERRRFQNLLTRLSRNQVVLLSTHIVEDVADLCPRMAVLARGRVLLRGEPEKLIERFAGRLWRVRADISTLKALGTTHTILSTRHRVAGPEVRLLADEPPVGAEPAAPNLEDVYLATLADAGVDIGLADELAF
ncbi:MAG: ABC transporter ATP-binding protein [Pseudomonadales bacterium]|nr:ABC transporter ATP-binding protein [Pseudomonadales bacterium]